MKNYGLLKATLAGIFSTSVGYDEDEAKDELKNDLDSNKEFRDNFEKELIAAFSDLSFSWQSIFEEYDIFSFNNETDAKKYATEILWNVVFKDKPPPNK